MSLVKTIASAIALALWVLAPPGTAAETVQSVAEIQQRVRDFLLAEHAGRAETPDIRVDRLDPRLRLVPCGEELEAFLPGGARTLGNTSVGVRCAGPRPWTVYLRARVRLLGEVLVAGRFLSRGTTLTAADLRVERRDLATLASGFETVPARLIGRQMRRSLQAGVIIAPHALTTPLLIRRGQRVSIVAHKTGLEVSSSGIAMGDAGSGDRLRVRNASSGRVIEGTVRTAHRIEVEL